MQITSLKNIRISFGDSDILRDASVDVHRGDRIALTGRNGSGKSTLMRLISGRIESDEGTVWRADGLTYSVLEQELPGKTSRTVYDVLASAFDDIGDKLAAFHQITVNMTEDHVDELTRLQTQIDAADGWNLAHRIEAVIDRMGLPSEKKLEELSGGWLKRIAIARSLVTEPDVWLLDEPTNHLDLPTIAWLERQMLEFQGTIIFVSHDRALMQSVAKSIVSIDRGRLIRWDCDYHTYLDRYEKWLELEEKENERFDERLKKEEAWIRTGIKARRTRNEGRVRALQEMREQRKERISLKSMKMEVDSGLKSGKVVKELVDVSKSFDGVKLIDHFDLIIQRGDRIGILGPNGSGKSTLVNLLLERIEPDSGVVHTGTKLETSYYDQTRAQLDPEMSVSDYITEGRQYVTINGKDTHIVSYLGNFMFDPDQARAPIRTLSGGEQNRLLLARLFSIPANFLVMDEPTNDLDVESLELLEELLLNYDGTVVIVSHDRSFMDNVVSSLLVFEGNGVVREYVGGYSDWKASGGSFEAPATAKTKAAAKPKQGRRPRVTDAEKRINAISRRLDAIEAEIETAHASVSVPEFFEKPEAEREQAYADLKALEDEQGALYEEWESLEG